ncbi:uncharacterized protein LOC119600394 [Lucilia sericata]|uniref:uncharacterized protein LOC119600394 n=1 Tax=Lucilia sericata TaxID=13632 RepID=UPI0018A82E2D|nr:uncharacterized protein LOC119600394 [Lucilia sericata]
MFKLANLVVLMSTFCVIATAAPYQELPPKPGYVPVYIREGNTPLSQVNPKLVEAFHEYEVSNLPQLEVEIPKKVEVTTNNKLDKVAENVEQDNDEGETNEQSKNLGEEKDESKQIKEHVQQDEKQLKKEETPASDIAEFTNDAIKVLADGNTDN